MKSQKGNFFGNRRNRSPSELHGGSLFKTFNRYSFNFNGGLCNPRTGFCLRQTPRPRGEQFLWFLKTDFCDFNAFSPFRLKQTFLFMYMCLIRITIDNLCPNMINFDAVDFSECRSEEVIRFYWHIYIYTGWPRKNATLTINNFKKTRDRIKKLCALLRIKFFSQQDDTKIVKFDEGVLILWPFFWGNNNNIILKICPSNSKVIIYVPKIFHCVASPGKLSALAL